MDIFADSPFDDCDVTSIELTKDEEGTSLDLESGKGVVSYDPDDQIIVIDKSIRGGNFTCFAEITTVDDAKGYLPITVAVFRVVLEPSVLVQQYVYDNGGIDMIPLEDLKTDNITFE